MACFYQCFELVKACTKEGRIPEIIILGFCLSFVGSNRKGLFISYIHEPSFSSIIIGGMKMNLVTLDFLYAGLHSPQ